MKYNARKFAVRDNRNALQGSCKQVCLNKPGRAVPFFLKGSGWSRSPLPGIFFYTKMRDHAHRDFHASRPGQHSPDKPGNKTSETGRFKTIFVPAFLPINN